MRGRSTSGSRAEYPLSPTVPHLLGSAGAAPADLEGSPTVWAPTVQVRMSVWLTHAAGSVCLSQGMFVRACWFGSWWLAQLALAALAPGSWLTRIASWLTNILTVLNNTHGYEQRFSYLDRKCIRRAWLDHHGITDLISWWASRVSFHILFEYSYGNDTNDTIRSISNLRIIITVWCVTCIHE